jgi:hypothetical protein
VGNATRPPFLSTSTAWGNATGLSDLITSVFIDSENQSAVKNDKNTRSMRYDHQRLGTDFSLRSY